MLKTGRSPRVSRPASGFRQGSLGRSHPRGGKFRPRAAGISGFRRQVDSGACGSGHAHRKKENDPFRREHSTKQEHRAR